MVRWMIVVVATVAAAEFAFAETWMVKSTTLGCCERETLVTLDASGSEQTSDNAGAEGCVVLNPGERLLDLPGSAGGFDLYVKLQRHDRSEVFVRGSAVVPDPGIGSVYDER